MKNRYLLFFCCFTIIFFTAGAHGAESGSEQKSLRFVEEQTDVIKTPTFTSKGWHWGKTVKVDKAFAEKYKTRVPPASFTVGYPNKNSVRVLPGKGTQSPWYIMFGFFAEGETDFNKRPLEVLRFTELHIKMEDAETRLKKLAALMRNELPKSLAKDWPQGKPVELYQTKVGPYDAVTLLVIVQDTKGVNFWARYTGILNPDSKFGVLALAIIDIEQSGMKSVEELHKNGKSLQVIHTVRFRKSEEPEEEELDEDENTK